MSRHAFYLFYRSKSQTLRLARTMSRQEACRLTRFLCNRFSLNVPGVCISRDYKKSVYTHIAEIFDVFNTAMFRRIDKLDEIKAFAMGQKRSAQSKVFACVLRTSNFFEIINFFSLMCEYFLKAIFFKSSLV